VSITAQCKKMARDWREVGATMRQSAQFLEVAEKRSSYFGRKITIP